MSLLDKYVELPVAKLELAEWNYKKTDDKESQELMEKLQGNLKKNGQIENLIVRLVAKDRYEVVNGNHRLMALRQLKAKTAVCYDLGKMSQEEAERIAVETNETKFAADPLKLAELVSRLTQKFKMEDLVDTMPMRREEMENYTKLLKFDWSQYEKALDESSADSGDGEGSGDEWETLEIRLPGDVMALYKAQIDRFKRALNPDKDPDDVSLVPAIECMTAHLSEIPDEMLSGE